MSPIVDSPDFPPGCASPIFQRWREEGCKRVGSLFDLNSLIPFTQLRRDYDLQQSDAFHHAQVTHWVTQPQNYSRMSRPMTTFERWLVRKKDDCKLISEFYSMIIANPQKPRTTAQVRWETELGRPLSHKEWEHIFYRAHHTASNTAGVESAFKVVNYWYYTPERVHCRDKFKSNLCWRGYRLTGTLAHLLWHWLKLVRYWGVVIDDIDKALQITLPRAPEYTLLGLSHTKFFPLKSLRGKQISMGLLEARQVLLALWKTNDS